MSRIDLIVLLRMPDKEIPVMPRSVARNAVRLKPVSCRSLDRVDKYNVVNRPSACTMR